MSQTLEEKRIAELTELVEEFLCEGEEYVVRCQDDEIEVLPAATSSSPLKRSHEELYGLLLSLNQQLTEAARWPRWIVRFVFWGVILGLHLDWFSGVAGLPIDVQKLQTPWAYVLIFLFGFGINSVIKEWQQHRIYARHRAELLHHLQNTGLGRYRVLSQIQGDPGLGAIAQWLKRDHAQEERY